MLLSTPDIRRRPRSLSAKVPSYAYRAPRSHSFNWDYYSYYPTVNTMRVSANGEVVFISRPKHLDRSWMLPDEVEYYDDMYYPRWKKKTRVKVINEEQRRRRRAVKAKFRRWLKYVAANPALPYELMAKLSGMDVDLDNFLEYVISLCVQDPEVKVEDWTIEDFYALLLRYVTKYLGRGYNYLSYYEPTPYTPDKTLYMSDSAALRPPIPLPPKGPPYPPVGINPYATPSTVLGTPPVPPPYPPPPIDPYTDLATRSYYHDDLPVPPFWLPRSKGLLYNSSHPQVPVDYSFWSPSQVKMYAATPSRVKQDISEKQAFFDAWKHYTRDPIAMFSNRRWHTYNEPTRYNRRHLRWRNKDEPGICYSSDSGDEHK